MSIKDIISKSLKINNSLGDPVSLATKGKYGANVTKHNPIGAYKRGKESGAGTGDRVMEVLDPGHVMGGGLPDTPEQSAAYITKAKEKAAKRKASGMKAGGKTTRKYSKGGSTSKRACCKGMGAATRGGSYGK